MLLTDVPEIPAESDSVVRYDVPVTVHVLVESSVKPIVPPLFAAFTVPVKEELLLSIRDTVLMLSKITLPGSAVPLAVSVTRPPLDPEAPLVRASASKNVLMLFVSVTFVNEKTAVVFVTANIVAGLFCPDAALRLEQAVAVQEYVNDPPDIVK